VAGRTNTREKVWGSFVPPAGFQKALWDEFASPPKGTYVEIAAATMLWKLGEAHGRSPGPLKKSVLPARWPKTGCPSRATDVSVSVGASWKWDGFAYQRGPCSRKLSPRKIRVFLPPSRNRTTPIPRAPRETVALWQARARWWDPWQSLG